MVTVKKKKDVRITASQLTAAVHIPVYIRVLYSALAYRFFLVGIVQE